MKINEGDGVVVLSVSEYLERLNVALGGESGFVEGEVTEFRAGEKWVGFTLKDHNMEPGALSAAVLKCVMHAHMFKRLGVSIEDGMLVKCYGTPRISKGWGSLGFWVETIEPVGEGSLKKAYELLVKKLKGEGLFERKRALPEFITRIGVISSRDGVVIQDLRKNLAKLGTSIKMVHTNVEGANAVPGILRAFNYFVSHSQDYDVLVVIRGGGSLESMQAFNNEEVARALYACPIPVIAGIGHDVDVPIVALVADAEGSTPTAVAGIINASWSSLTIDLPQLEKQIIGGMDIAIYRYKNDIANIQGKMLGYFTAVFRSFDNLVGRITRGRTVISERISVIKQSILRTEKLLAIADPLRNLRLGYSLTMLNGKIVKSGKDVRMGDVLETRLADGKLESRVTEN